MKKSFKILGLLAIAVMSITACTEDNTVSPSAAIVGFWGVNNRIDSLYLDNQFIQADTSILATDSLTFNFTADGLAIKIKKVSMGAYVNDTSYYTLTGTNLQIIDKSAVPYDTINYIATITGNKFNMKDTQIDTTSDGVVKVILEYNATKLVR